MCRAPGFAPAACVDNGVQATLSCSVNGIYVFRGLGWVMLAQAWQSDGNGTAVQGDRACVLLSMPALVVGPFSPLVLCLMEGFKAEVVRGTPSLSASDL
eukprot:CAMPEP_0202873128 /NCGR_PEP_ID=MMETSP1391-20130828/22686_1 /ASSEMBLY_ACC=CAM_ASM_000867 /TAXON_ID=1034604 /ORGANISM="Chlamydomonas leiostraca, Strain SAG 11-49" /LENGTH=98 /DNA_ID=CAMNT_0049554297 /DNA_START=282 /DNA_END=578 /DNA_ORIENTATION=+